MRPVRADSDELIFMCMQSNAEDIQQIFKDSDTFRKSEALLGTISEWLGNGLATESDIGKHAEMRRILNPAFRVDYIKGLSPVFGQIGSKLADDILSMGEHDIQVRIDPAGDDTKSAMRSLLPSGSMS